MYKKDYKYYFVVAAAVLFSLTACKKWVDVKPSLGVDQSTVFSNEQGFRDVLNAVYLQIGSKDMYGRDMTYGLLSVLGRSYDTTISNAISNIYYQGAQYNLQDPDVNSVAKNIWVTTYQSIGSLNNLLDNIDTYKSKFTGNNYNTIKGEAIGLRAFLHFELLRLFAPSPAAGGLTALAIPYMIHFSPYAAASGMTGEVLDNCIGDLKTSESLLSESDFTMSHFTIWATRGLLARVYLYKGDNTNASLYAKALINSGKFPLAANNSDLMFGKEQLFSLYVYQNDIFPLYKSVLNATKPLGFTTLNQTALFVNGSGATTDWRKAFVDPTTGVATGNTISPRKFYASSSPSPNVAAIPLIRMSEMYYIAAECAANNNDMASATDLLDSIRFHRGVTKDLTPTISSDSVTIEIRKEYQKEFLGEGQMFFYYKRKNLPFASLPYTKVPVVPGASYVFIKPE